MPLPARRLRVHPSYALVRLPDTTAVLVRRSDGQAFAVSDAVSKAVAGSFEPTSGPAAALVVDGYLELRTEGRWRSGPSALAHFDLPPPSDSADLGPLARLSRSAIRYAAHLRLRDPGELARRLYTYHRLPATPAWSRRLATVDAVRAWLDHPSTVAALTAGWSPVPPPSGNDRWRIFCRRDGGLGRGRPTRHKLYVSPTPEHLDAALAATVQVLSDHRAPIFKVADDLYGVLRSDKLVAYFTTRAHLDAVATDLAAALDDVPAQGVPFSAACTASGLLSWALDPPPATGASSWRGWVCERLSAALLQTDDMRGDVAASETPADAAVDYALRRLRLDGVDTDRWTPLACPPVANQPGLA